MKRLIVIIFILPLLITACDETDPNEQEQDHVEAFRANGYNYTKLKKQGYKRIRFMLPEALKYNYSTEYCFKSDALSRRDFPLGVVFSVERLTEDDVHSELFEESILTEEDLLNSFHDAYTDRRYESLYESAASFKKDVKKTVKFDGVIQTIRGQHSVYAEELYYATATLQVGKEYYVFQLITTKDMMDYVYDDFERILASVRKK